MGQTDKVCSKHVCPDGVDDDGDARTTIRTTRAARTPYDNDETDDCPNGANCPKCSNDSDDDNDTKNDYPADPSCTSAASDAEVCKTTEAVAEIAGGTTLGDTTNATDDYKAGCTYDVGGKDLAYEINLPQLWSFTYQAHDPTTTSRPRSSERPAAAPSSRAATASIQTSSVRSPPARTSSSSMADDMYTYGTFTLDVVAERSPRARAAKARWRCRAR